MKKYNKPEVYCEVMKPSVITGGCDYTAAATGEIVPFPVGGGVMLFLEETAACDMTPENMGIQICYHGYNPNDQNNVFDS